MDQKTIIPIENFIFDGIVKKLQQTFGCYVQYSNSSNKVLEMQKIRNRNITLPYMFVGLSSMTAIQDFYNSNYLSRHGVKIRQADTNNALAKAKILPVRFEFRIEFYTDKSSGEGSVLAYMKRWMFARRLGYLKYTIVYGDTTYACSVEMDENVSQPIREEDTGQMALYMAETTLSVIGYVSEPELLTDGVVSDIRVSTEILGVKDTEKQDYYWNMTK